MNKCLLLVTTILLCLAIACNENTAAVPSTPCTVSNKVYTPGTTELVPVPQNTAPGIPLPSAGGYRLLPRTVSESYVLVLQCGDRKKERKVNQGAYNCYSVGDLYPSDGCSR